jgi:hypothetical protein
MFLNKYLWRAPCTRTHRNEHKFSTSVFRREVSKCSWELVLCTWLGLLWIECGVTGEML